MAKKLLKDQRNYRAASLEEHSICPWTVDNDDDDLYFVSTNQNPEFSNTQGNQRYLMKARIVKKQSD